MRLLKIAGVATAVAGGVALAAFLATDVAGQVSVRAPRARAFDLVAGGSHIGVAIRDLDDADAKREKTAQSGVAIDEVYTDSPAARAGLKAGDIVVEFDGERVRSARQFARLVTETPEGRAVKLGAVRDGQRMTVDITPEAGPAMGEWKFRGDFSSLTNLNDELREWMPKIAAPDIEVRTLSRTRRLGVQIDTLTPQLAAYFGATRGALVTSVEEGSAAEKAGLKAGDVITAIDGRTIEDTADIMRALRSAGEGVEVKIDILRDRKPQSLKTTFERRTGPSKTRRRVADI